MKKDMKWIIVSFLILLVCGFFIDEQFFTYQWSPIKNTPVTTRIPIKPLKSEMVVIDSLPKPHGPHKDLVVFHIKAEDTRYFKGFMIIDRNNPRRPLAFSVMHGFEFASPIGEEQEYYINKQPKKYVRDTLKRIYQYHYQGNDVVQLEWNEEDIGMSVVASNGSNISYEIKSGVREKIHPIILQTVSGNAGYCTTQETMIMKTKSEYGSYSETPFQELNCYFIKPFIAGDSCTPVIDWKTGKIYVNSTSTDTLPPIEIKLNSKVYSLKISNGLSEVPNQNIYYSDSISARR